MLSFEFTRRISEFLYQWVMDVSEGAPRGSLYTKIFSNDGVKGGHGMEYCLFYLVGVSLVTAAIFYFLVASSIQNATKKNYITSFVVGFVCLVVINYLATQIILPEVNVLKSFNMVKVCLVDIVYYTVAFELWSLLMKDSSKAGGLHLLTAIK